MNSEFAGKLTVSYVENIFPEKAVGKFVLTLPKILLLFML